MFERANLRQNYFIRNMVSGSRLLFKEKIVLVYLAFCLGVVVLALIGPTIAPYDPGERVYRNGELIRSTPPSLLNPLGTDTSGRDVFSRLVVGARPTVVTGLLGGSMIIGIGLTIGVVAGYVGGLVDDILMRFTDLVYGVPLIPFAIVLLAFLGIGFFTSIIVIGLLLWRGNARVIRSQVLQIKNYHFVRAAQAMGANRYHVITRHILPNVASMAILFFSLGIAYSILIQASLAFIGVSNPFVPSWGIMVRNAYNSGISLAVWWWFIPPGLMISMTVISTFMLGRQIEQIAIEEEDTLAVMG